MIRNLWPKLRFFYFMIILFLKKNRLLRCWGWLFLLNWIRTINLSLLLPPEKIWALTRSVKSLSPEVALYLYKSTIRLCMEYCCHVGAGASSFYLKLFNKLRKWLCRFVGPSLEASLESLPHCWNVANLSLFCSHYFGRCLSELAPRHYSRRRSTHDSDRLQDFFVTIFRCYKDICVSSFFPCLARIWNSPPIECFPLTYDQPYV